MFISCPSLLPAPQGALDSRELKELRHYIRGIHPDRFPHPLTPAIADQIMGVDSDGDGCISRPEWIDFVIAQAKTHGERPVKRLMKVLANELARRWRPA